MRQPPPPPPPLVWANHLVAKRYDRNMSNLVGIMNNWIADGRRLSIIDFHALWSKCMDLRFRRLQELVSYGPITV